MIIEMAVYTYVLYFSNHPYQILSDPTTLYVAGEYMREAYDTDFSTLHMYIRT